MGKVRICMIGAGMMANKVHYPSLASFENVDMVGICDLDEQKIVYFDEGGTKNEKDSRSVWYPESLL